MFGTVEECPRCGAKNANMDELHDARGIYCGSACDHCMPDLEKRYRPEVLSNPQYDCDEQIDPD